MTGIKYLHIDEPLSPVSTPISPFILWSWNSIPAKQQLLTPPLPAPGDHRSTVCLYDFGKPEYLIKVESCNICLFVTGLFHAGEHPQGSSIVAYCRFLFPLGGEYDSILCLDHILLICSSIDGLLGCALILIIPVLLWTWVYNLEGVHRE